MSAANASLNNKVVLLTGATSGLGEATALRLAARGASIVIAGRRQERGDAVAAAAKAAGAKDALFVKTDVTNSEDVAALFQQAKTHFGGVDAVFVNAGAFAFDNFLEDNDKALDLSVDVNIRGTTIVTRHAVNAIRERGSGDLILTSSILASVAVGSVDAFGAGNGIGVYAASKAYVDALARSLTAVPEVRSFTVAPSVYGTEMPGAAAGQFAAAAHGLLKGVVGRPDEIAQIVEAIVDGTTAWKSGSLIATEGPYTYDGGLRYAEVYNPELRGKLALAVPLDQVRDARGKPAGLTQEKVDKIIAASKAAAAETAGN